jgi:hypothetical protein
LVHGRHAGAIAEVREDDAAGSGRGIAQAREFFHQVSVRQAVEAVALNSLRVEAPGNGQQLGDAGHGGMKRRVEAGDLGNFWITLREGLDQFDFAGQMFGIIRAEAAQFLQQFRRDALRLGVGQAVDDAMADGFDGGELALVFEPINQGGRGRFGVLSSEIWAGLGVTQNVAKCQGRSAQADPGDLAGEKTLPGLAGFVKGELDARGTAIDGQDGIHEISFLRLGHIGFANGCPA